MLSHLKNAFVVFLSIVLSAAVAEAAVRYGVGKRRTSGGFWGVEIFGRIMFSHDAAAAPII